MKYGYLLLLIVIIFSGFLAPCEKPVYGVDVFNTGPFECGTQYHTRWTNDIGNIRIYTSQLWMGMYPGNKSDFGYQVHRVSDSSLLYRGNWDHYADPVGIDGQLHTMNFTPNYFKLKKGDALELWYKCQKQGDIGHIIVTIWYSK